MTKLSIRWRLTLWYGATLALALGGFCVLVLLLARHQLLAHTDAALREELQELVLEVQMARNMPELESELQRRFFQHDIYDFRVLDAAGRVVFASTGLKNVSEKMPPQKSASASTLRYETHPLGRQGDYRIASTPAQSPLGPFTVQAMTSLTPYYAEIQTLETIVLILLPLVLVAASAGGYLLAGRALAPVKQIANVANSITIDRLDRRIEIANPDDEIGRLAATLNSLIARLQRAVNEIQRFTADASHELRTPLAALLSEAESALRSPRSHEDYKQTLAVVVEEATRLGRLADQLLNLSRQDAGILQYAQGSVRLDALLWDVADQLRPLAEKQNLRMECGEMQSCELQGDDIRLSQAFFNVLENAVKYTPAGGHIEVRCRISQGSAQIEIQDDGIGIPAEKLPHVFDRFYRVDPSRSGKVGGAGLGLSIARAAIMAHSGDIQVQSQSGAGTTVTIQLPGAEPACDDFDSGPSLAAVGLDHRKTIKGKGNGV